MSYFSRDFLLFGAQVTEELYHKQSCLNEIHRFISTNNKKNHLAFFLFCFCRQTNHILIEILFKFPIKIVKFDLIRLILFGLQYLFAIENIAKLSEENKSTTRCVKGTDCFVKLKELTCLTGWTIFLAAYNIFFGCETVFFFTKGIETIKTRSKIID